MILAERARQVFNYTTDNRLVNVTEKYSPYNLQTKINRWQKAVGRNAESWNEALKLSVIYLLLVFRYTVRSISDAYSGENDRSLIVDVEISLGYP